MRGVQGELQRRAGEGERGGSRATPAGVLEMCSTTIINFCTETRVDLCRSTGVQRVKVTRPLACHIIIFNKTQREVSPPAPEGN